MDILGLDSLLIVNNNEFFLFDFSFILFDQYLLLFDQMLIVLNLLLVLFDGLGIRREEISVFLHYLLHLLHSEVVGVNICRERLNYLLFLCNLLFFCSKNLLMTPNNLIMCLNDILFCPNNFLFGPNNFFFGVNFISIVFNCLIIRVDSLYLLKYLSLFHLN